MASNSLSIEIGSYSIRAALFCNGKTLPIPLGFSSSPYSCPSIAAKIPGGGFYFGEYAKYWVFNSPENFYHLCDIEDSSKLIDSIYASLFDFVIGQIKRMGYEFPDTCYIIIPAYYSSADPRKTKILNAATHSGFRNVSFTSDAIATCMKAASIAVDETVMTFDFGYSGITISLIKRNNSGLDIVKSIHNGTLSGRQIDGLIIEDIEKQSMNHVNGDILDSLLYMNNLSTCAEHIKEILSYAESCTQSVIQGKYTINRSRLVDMVAPLFSSALQSCKEIINLTGIKYQDIKQILLFGGGANIPMTEEFLRKHFIGNGCNSIVIHNLAKRPDYKYLTCFGSIYTIGSSSLIF